MNRDTSGLVTRGPAQYELGCYIDGVLNYLAPDRSFVVDREAAWKMSPGKAYAELIELRKTHTTVGRYAWIVLKAGEAGQVSERTLLHPKQRQIV